MSKAAARVILNEIRIHLCPSSIESQGVRQFVTNGGYKKLKISNPSLPIMVRENEGVSAKVFARYDLGRESKKSLEGMSIQQVEQEIKKLFSG